MFTVCSNCGDGSQIQKVSAIVDAGTTTSSYQSIAPITGKDKTYYVSVPQEATLRTELAKKLAAPKISKAPKRKSAPRHARSLAVIYGIFVNPFIVLVIIESLMGTGSYTYNTIKGIIVILLFISVPIGLYKLLTSIGFRRKDDAKTELQYEQDYQHKLNIYNSELKVLDKWKNLYYCHKCGSVFVPGSQHFAPVGEMRSFIIKD